MTGRRWMSWRSATRHALKAHYSARLRPSRMPARPSCAAPSRSGPGSRASQLDCTGEGEIAIAVAARLVPTSILVHGVNKSRRQTWKQRAARAGVIVVDNLSELHRLPDLLVIGRRRREAPSPSDLAAVAARRGRRDPSRHTQTGQLDSKFGMTPSEIA